MLDIGWQELFLIGVVALIVIGPKDLPKAMRAVAHGVRKARGLAREFQSGLDEMMREAEIDDLKRQMQKAASFDIDAEVRKTVDPGGTLTDAFDPETFARDLKERVEMGPPAPPQPAPAPAAPPAPTLLPPVMPTPVAGAANGGDAVVARPRRRARPKAGKAGKAGDEGR
jgi:sec-independent protein translocase protein TatB